jgi:hypothetical protein
MMSVLLSVLLTLRGSARSRAALQRARSPRPLLARADRLLWVWLSRVWNQWAGGSRLCAKRLILYLGCSEVTTGEFESQGVQEYKAISRCLMVTLAVMNAIIQMIL